MVQLGRTPFTLISLVFDNNPHCDSYVLEFPEIKLTNSRENKSLCSSKKCLLKESRFLKKDYLILIISTSFLLWLKHGFNKSLITVQ